MGKREKSSRSHNSAGDRHDISMQSWISMLHFTYFSRLNGSHTSPRVNTVIDGVVYRLSISSPDYPIYLPPSFP
jgi:hypothetical protein